MKIYTKTGDDGTTGLIGGRRVPKCEAHMECCGAVDELNAALGVAAVTADPSLLALLRPVQNELFIIGCHLATPDDSPHRAGLPPLEPRFIQRLEQQIDAADADLPRLAQFILPGGTETAARLHLARTVCRRAERLIVLLAQQNPVEPILLQYINRLCDWLFVQARRKPSQWATRYTLG